MENRSRCGFGYLPLIIWIFSLLGNAAFGEGSKEIYIGSDNVYLFSCNDVVGQCNNGGPRTRFASYGGPENDRLYFVKLNLTETIYMGFKGSLTTPSSSSAHIVFRIKNLAGTVVYPTDGTEMTLPSSGTGYIPDIANARVGPTQIYGVGGYTAINFHPADTGTFYIEWTRKDADGLVDLGGIAMNLLDITVYDTIAHLVKPGRLYSKSWQFQENGGCSATTYVYSVDSIITSCQFSNMDGGIWVQFCNQWGCENTGNFEQDRKSKNSQSLLPQFKIFVNNPDPVLFVPAVTLGHIVPPDPYGVQDCNTGSITFYVNVDKPGDVAIELSFSGGYVTRIIKDGVEIGENLIVWDGMDGTLPTGVPVPNGIDVTFTVQYINGLTNLPFYDVETNTAGFIIAMVNPPAPEPPIVFWDDSSVGGTSNLTGCQSPPGCHSWSSNFGNLKTINTWWYNISETTVPITIAEWREPGTLIFNQSPPQTYCAGASSILFSVGPDDNTLEYHWDFTGLGATITQNHLSDPFISVNFSQATTGDITVYGTNSNCGIPSDIVSLPVTINPIPTVDPVSNQVVCNGAATTAITFSGTTDGTTYSWTNNTPSIGLAANGTGNIAPFAASNSTNSPVTATITATPSFTSGGLTCTGTPTSFTITVNPPGDVTDPTSQVLCNGASTSVTFASSNTGGTTSYAWTNDNTAIGLAAAGSGDIPAFDVTNAGLAPIVANITVTPAFTNEGVSCDGPPQTFTITVNPEGDVTDPTNQVLCNGASTSVTFASSNTVGTTTFAWVNDNTTIGLAASGTGDVPAFNVTNAGLAPILGTITVTPTFTNEGVSCDGPTQTFSITVNPEGDVTDPIDMVVCNEASTAVAFASSNTGGNTTYAWTNSNTDIGLAASGTGNITSFNATNTGLAPIVGTITVTPTFTNEGVACIGPVQTFSITVNPEGDVTDPADMVVCNQASTSVAFASSNTGGITTYAWTNDNTAIGLAASGTSNISPFIATNAGLAPIVGNITVTPTFTNEGVSCIGPVQTFSITVNPEGNVTDPVNQVLCHDASTSVTFASSNTGGTTIYTWANDNIGIGLAASGTGNIDPFNVTNPGLAPIVANITVTPTFTNGATPCVGPEQTFTITVNPPGDVTDPTSQVLCNGASTSVTFASSNTGGTTSYAWTNDNTAIGLAAAGSGDIPAFNVTNAGLAPIVANITVTPAFTNEGVSCDGPPQTFTITVNPEGDVTDPTNQVLCNGASTSVTFASSNTVGTTTFAWVNDNTTIGLAASGTGDVPAFNVTNAGLAPIVANITVTPTFTNEGVSCDGPAQTFTITVNPKPDLLFPATPANPQEICSGTSSQPVTLSSSVTVPGVSYAWTAEAFDPVLPTSLITGFTTPSPANPAAIPADNITSLLLTQGVVKYTVTPYFNSPGLACPGDPLEYQTLVNPSPSVTLNPSDPTGQTICSGQSSAPITFTPNATPVIYDWEPVETININETPLSGTTENIPSQIFTLTGLVQGHVKYKVTPSYQGGGTFVCPGGVSYSTIFVNPLPTPAIAGLILTCELGPEVTYSTPHVDGNSYAWVVTGGTIASGTGTHQITIQWGSYTASPGTITLTETINATGCLVTTPTYQVTLQQRPIPTLAGLIDVCTGSTLNVYNSDAGNFNYTWTINGGTFTGGSTSTSPSATVTWDTPGNNWIEVNYQNALGCPGFPAKHINVLVNPLPVTTITQGAGPDCNGQAHTYQTPLDLACTYTWSATPGVVVGGQSTNNASINWLAAGTATVAVTGTYIGTTGCTSSSTFPTTVYPSPEPSFTPCFDLVTTQNAKPILLKGGLPLGGEFQGSPAISYDIITEKYWFNTASALIAPGVHPITYRSQNSYGCANTSSEVPITLLPSNASFTCNTNFTDPRDGKSYATVMLGSQCWFRENLRYSAPSPYTSTPLSSPQSDNCTFERHCLTADPTCTTYGGFYQWNELMQYNDDLSATRQGFCPPGWHVPSATEWQNMIDASQGPGVASGELKDLTATQSFRAILGGIGYLNNIWSFTTSDSPTGSFYWTSTLTGNKPVARGLNTFNPSVSIYEGSPANAFPVRCVKDN